MSASFILLDIGGTDIKTASVLNGTTTLENVRRVNFPDFLPSNIGRKEVDADHLLDLVRNEITIARSQLEHVDGILISGQMGCWTLIEGSAEINRIVSWQDERSKSDKLLSIGAELLKVNGGEFQAGVPALGALHKLKESKSQNQDLRFETMCSYISQGLCDPETNALCHVSDAAASGLYDIYELTWVPEKMSNQLCLLNYPHTTSAVEIVGHLKNSNIPIYAAVGDQQASLLGSGISKSNLILNIGTGGQVATILEKGNQARYKVRPFFNGEFISTRTHLPAGRFISSLLNVMNERYLTQVSYEDLCNWSLESEFIIDADQLLPENCSQLLKELTRAGMEIELAVSSILRSVALAYVETVREMLSKHHEQIVFAGGVGQRFINFQEFVGTELQKNVRVSRTVETTLQGLAYLAKGIHRNSEK